MLRLHGAMSGCFSPVAAGTSADPVGRSAGGRVQVFAAACAMLPA